MTTALIVVFALVWIAGLSLFIHPWIGALASAAIAIWSVLTEDEPRRPERQPLELVHDENWSWPEKQVGVARSGRRAA